MPDARCAGRPKTARLIAVRKVQRKPEPETMAAAPSALVRCSREDSSHQLGAQPRAEITQALHQGRVGRLDGRRGRVRLGADAVGMSTVLETIQARALGLETAAFSCLTNWAAGITAAHLDHHEVLETGKQAAQAMIGLLTDVLG